MRHDDVQVRLRAGREPRGWLVPVLLLGAAAVSALVQAVVVAAPLPVESNVPEAAATWAVVLGTAALAAAALVPRLPSWARAVLTVAALAATATAVLALPLHGTSYYFGGLVSDQQFRIQYLTRLAASPALADMNYAELPPFYPAGWFWVGGRLADLVGMAPWAAYKWVALTTMGVTPAVVWIVWSRLVGARTAVGVAVVTLVAGISLAATEPYSWPAVALLPAAAVAFWRELVRPVRPRTAVLLVVGAFLGAAAATYSLYAGFGALLLAVLAGVSVAVAGRGRADALRRAASCLGVAAVPAVLGALLVWAPFVVEVLRSGMGSNAAARFLPLVSAELPEVVTADAWGLLLTGGAVVLLARLVTPWGRLPQAQMALLVTATTAYAWYGLSTLAILGGSTLLAFRMESLVVLTLGTAAVLALSELVRRAPAELAARGWSPVRAGVAGGAAAVLVLTQVATDRGHDLDERVDDAYSTPYPSGPDATGAEHPDREEGWSDALAAEIGRLTQAPPQDTVVLSTNYSLVALHPFRAFQQITPHYANPLADYEERADFVRSLAGSADADDLLARLDASPWRAPTVFVLGRQDDGLHVRLGRDTFPASPNVAFDEVVFDADLFDSPRFRTAAVGPFTVAVRQG